MTPRTALRTTTLLALLLFLALPTTAGAQDAQALVRVVHLSADAPKVDLYVDGTRTLQAVSFKTASRYRSLPAGAHTLAIRPAGSAPTSTPVASVRASVRAGAPYSTVLLGPAAQLKAVVVRDDFAAPPAGRAKLRVIDAAPQSPPLDIAVADGPVLFRDVRFGEVTPFVTVAAGSMSMEVRAAGTPRVLFTQGAARIPAGMIVTLAGTISAAGQIETLPILDAAGAGSLPRGGVATGAGDSAPDQAWRPLGLLPVVGLLAATAWAAGRRSGVSGVRIAGRSRVLTASCAGRSRGPTGALGARMGDAGRWRGFQAGRRRSYVGRHEARPGKVAARRAAAVVGVVAVAAIAVAGLSSSGSREADPLTARPPPPAPQLIAAPGFGAGLGDWRAFPGTYLIKGQLGDPSAMFARIQRDPTVAAAKDPATGSTMTGLAIRVVVGATGRMQLRATVPLRGSRPGITVIVRLSERVGDRRVDESERRARLRDTGWHEVEAGHRVLQAGASVHLEVWALALPRDQAIYVGQAKVTSA